MTTLIWTSPVCVSLRKCAGLLLGTLVFVLPAHATWIDDDPICESYGCVVVHDGISFSVYDNYDIAAGRTLSPGEPLIQRTTNTLPGTGTVNPVITGSLNEALSTAPLADQGAMLGIDTNGDGIGDRFPLDANNSGFLDAGDSLNPFDITQNTSIVGTSTSYQRSFYISSTTDFYMAAQALSGISGVGIDATSKLNTIGFTYQLTTRGNDDGMAFGRRSQPGNVNRPIGNVTTMADLIGQPVQIMEFRKAIKKKNAQTIAEQSVRFDYVYDFGGYDLSMGNGELNLEIEFSFYSR